MVTWRPWCGEFAVLTTAAAARVEVRSPDRWRTETWNNVWAAAEPGLAISAAAYVDALDALATWRADVTAARRSTDAATEIHARTVCAGSSALVSWWSVPRAIGWKCWSSRALISQGGIIADADSC